MKHYYPLTAAQRMHHDWILRYKTQQVSGVSVVAALQMPLDFTLLQKCLFLEQERSSCMRIRFTKPDADGQVQQYLAPVDSDYLPIVDLSSLSMEEADETMQSWAYETFDGDDVSMCQIKMVKLPDDFQGFFLHMDHRLIDSCGLAVLIQDVIQLYGHFAFGWPYPKDLADYTNVLESDLFRANQRKRVNRDQKFWEDQLDALGEPLYADILGPSVLDKVRREHKDPELRAGDIVMDDLFVAVKDYVLEASEAQKLLNFCAEQSISMTNLLLLSLRTYLSKVNNGQEDITIENFISRRSTHEEWTSGGSRTIMFPCRTVISADTSFLAAAQEIQKVQNLIYLHSNYDPALIKAEMKRRYHTPKHTAYESCYLTYQPMQVTAGVSELDNIPIHAKWFANGAATKKMYLTVSHRDDGAMIFSYHYQTACYGEKDMEKLYYYMMRILFAGIVEPGDSVGKIMQEV